MPRKKPPRKVSAHRTEGRPTSLPAPLPVPVPTSYRDAFLALLLILLSLAVFAPLYVNTGPAAYQFINLDDPLEVSENPHVQAGLNPESVQWAFTTLHAYNWMPLTWLSLELDTQVYGVGPWGYHLTNVLLHVANVLLLFGVLRRLTGAAWCSAAVAALFAVHPLRVESVAWIAERKDVLSTLFWMLTLLAYTWYGERPSPRRYALVLLAFALGLMAKPMLVTLPCVLLLLDYWPLRRIQGWATEQSAGPSGRTFPPASLRFVLLEKAPLLALAVGISVLTLHAQKDLLPGLESLSFGVRVQNALVSYVRYLGKFAWPTDLALYYPHPGTSLPTATVVGAGLLLTGVTVAVVWTARRFPFLAVGWFWYLGTLVPVIGLVQLSNQGAADRWTYVPLTGIFLLLVWGLAELADRWHCQAFVGIAFALLIGAFGMVAWVQVHYWGDPRDLWQHTLLVTGDSNVVAHNQLGAALLDNNQLDAAEQHFQVAIRYSPFYADAYYNLGAVQLRRHHLEEAIHWFVGALRINPAHAQALHGLGQAAVLAAADGRPDLAATIHAYLRLLEAGQPLPALEQASPSTS